MADILEFAVKAQRVIKVEERTYVLSFPLPVVVRLEEKLGRSMKSVPDWLRIQAKEVRDILAAGLASDHADEAERVADRLCQMLDPEEIDVVIDALCVAACPKAMANLQEEMDKARERVKNGSAALPNGQSADAS